LDQANSKHPVLPRHNWPRHHRINHTTKQRQSSASEAIQGIKHITPDQPLKKQLDDICTKTRQAITTTDAPHNKKGNNIARKKQQQLINKAPKKAHKEIFKDKNAQPRASLQAVKDPETGKIETEPTKQAQIFEKYFKDSWQAINNKLLASY